MYRTDKTRTAEAKAESRYRRQTRVRKYAPAELNLDALLAEVKGTVAR